MRPSSPRVVFRFGVWVQPSSTTERGENKTEYMTNKSTATRSVYGWQCCSKVTGCSKFVHDINVVSFGAKFIQIQYVADNHQPISIVLLIILLRTTPLRCATQLNG